MDKGICFLDFDGVINTRKIEYKNNKFIVTFYNARDDKFNNHQAILWISRLCIENNLDIVITSNHRNNCDLEFLKKKLYNNGLINKIKILGTIEKYKERNRGINEFLKNNPKFKDKYVIIDDENCFYIEDEELNNHLILCNTNHGFALDEYKKASELLNNKDKTKLLK